MARRDLPYEERLRIRMEELRETWHGPYADLLDLVEHDQEPGECFTCDAMRALAREDPTTPHEIDVQPGVSILMQMTYRPHCTCGWAGQWWDSWESAEAEGDVHLGSPC
jgi:hypothetical protein